MCAKCGDRFALLLANAKDLASVSAFSVFPRGNPESEAIGGICGPEQLPFSPLMVLQRRLCLYLAYIYVQLMIMIMRPSTHAHGSNKEK